MINELSNPVVVDFPLRGEWCAPHTPAQKIPSHGTDQLGQRFAYDFMMADWTGSEKTFFKGTALQYYLAGMRLNRWHGWGQPVYAPSDGIIITARDGMKERQRVHLIGDLLVVLKNSLFFKGGDILKVTGNYIIMQMESAYALFAHLKAESVSVSEGQKVKAGQLLGRVGHSGNSTAPHLHFQLMDHQDPFQAKGLPCAFTRYERFQDGKWDQVLNGIPSAEDRIRA